MNEAQAAQLPMYVFGDGPIIPCGWIFVELDQNLERWIRFHDRTFPISAIHALKLPVRGHFPRARTHTLRLEVSVNENHGGHVGKYFKLDAVEVKSIEEASTENDADGWNLIFSQLKLMREDAEMKGRGVTIATAIDCKPLAVQVVPTGSIMEMDMKREKWEEKLRRCIETGSMRFEA